MLGATNLAEGGPQNKKEGGGLDKQGSGELRLRHSALRLIGHMWFLRFGIRDRVIRLIAPPDMPQAVPFEVQFFGLRYRGDLSSFIDWSVYFYGAYARAELRMIGDVLEAIDKPVVLDVGANVGHHTLYMSRVAESVLSFEPFPPLYAECKKRVEANDLENVSVYQVGLGAKDALLQYSPPSSENEGTGSFVGNSSSEQLINLEVRSGDEFLFEQGIERVDFIKIDVEGFEAEVLEGLTKTFEIHRPACLFEWSEASRGSDRASTTRKGFPDRYTFYRFEQPRPVAKLFSRRGYRLMNVSDAWPDGYFLALPNEAISDRMGGLVMHAGVTSALFKAS